MTMRIAMWSGPRSISTAMMRAFENRSDTEVSDEPFYAAYLAATGLDHPMRAEVLASQPTDWHEVATALAGPPPTGRRVWYQKHMCHHMIDDFGLDWSDNCRNVFLIRSPERVLASYVAKRSAVTLEDIGIVRQAEIFDRVASRTGVSPPVGPGLVRWRRALPGLRAVVFADNAESVARRSASRRRCRPALLRPPGTL